MANSSIWSILKLKPVRKSELALRAGGKKWSLAQHICLIHRLAHYLSSGSVVPSNVTSKSCFPLPFPYHLFIAEECVEVLAPNYVCTAASEHLQLAMKGNIKMLLAEALLPWFQSHSVTHPFQHQERRRITRFGPEVRERMSSAQLLESVAFQTPRHLSLAILPTLAADTTYLKIPGFVNSVIPCGYLWVLLNCCYRHEAFSNLSHQGPSDMVFWAHGQQWSAVLSVPLHKTKVVPVLSMSVLLPLLGLKIRRPGFKFPLIHETYLAIRSLST